MISLKINGRDVRPADLHNALESAFLEQIEQHIRETVGSIRHPDTGEFPTVVVSGPSLDNLRINVEGSPELIALVSERLGFEEKEASLMVQDKLAPVAFLSYGWEDKDLAERIANILQANGIDTWWAEWCIGPGQSLRQKIDEGLGNCTHFIALLTETSLTKPWVNQEMDGALVRKLESKCEFIPVRYNLVVERLPLLIRGLLSPQINDPDVDTMRIVNHIHGISLKPPLGSPPTVVAEALKTATGYSPAATAIAKVFVEKSKNGTFADPQFAVSALATMTGLSVDDVEDALHELARFIRMSNELVPLVHKTVMSEACLFAEFDKYWMEWVPEKDGLRLAADLVNDEKFPNKTPEIAARYGWEPRRMNAALAYLVERDVIHSYETIMSALWPIPEIEKTAKTRRFVRSRSL